MRIKNRVRVIIFDIGFGGVRIKHIIMLNDEDITKLIGVFTTREEMKEMVANLTTKKDFNDLQTSVDSYAKKADAYFQEMLGIKLEY